MNKTSKYWVACSGGVDSVVLLHLICQLKPKKEVGVLHCNFQLRGDSSDEDEAFVRRLAEKLHIPIRIKTFDTEGYAKKNKTNTQLAARDLRYDWFETIIQKENGTVLLGHHYDDQVETFFLQLRRGGKVKGLAGMPVFRYGYLRPLLKYTKKDLISLAQKNNWEWREDVTNEFNDYTRNWYRNEILPALKQANFPLEDAVPLMKLFQKLLKFFEQMKLPTSIRFEDWRILPIWRKDFILSTHGLGAYSSSEVDRLTKAQKGRFIGNRFSKVWNEGHLLVFVKEPLKHFQYELKITFQSQTDFKNKPEAIFLDASKVKGGLQTRRWCAGDYFQPLGMKGEKSVAKFLRDRKVAAHQKSDIFILQNEKAQTIGIFGFGVGERFKIDDNTEKILQVELIESSSG